MPNKPLMPCRNCKAACVGPYCPNCKPQTHPSNTYAVKSRKPFFKEYHSKRWKDLTDFMRRSNPVCQLIEDSGKQCDRPSKYTHHLVSPNVDPSKLFDPSNLVCLCEHHHDNREGEQANDPRNFADTITRVMGIEQRFVHPKHDKRCLSTRVEGLPTHF